MRDHVRPGLSLAHISSERLQIYLLIILGSPTVRRMHGRCWSAQHFKCAGMQVSSFSSDKALCPPTDRSRKGCIITHKPSCRAHSAPRVYPVHQSPVSCGPQSDCALCVESGAAGIKFSADASLLFGLNDWRQYSAGRIAIDHLSPNDGAPSLMPSRACKKQ